MLLKFNKFLMNSKQTKNSSYLIFINLFLTLISLAFSLTLICSHEQYTLQAATYYIDATNGDDCNSGLSIKSAWRTVDKINNSIFNPGDYIFFKRGNIWREELNINSNGSYGSHITFGNYGDGNLPIIAGSDVIDSSKMKWTASGSGSNEFYCEAVDGGYHDLTEPTYVWIDSVNINRGSVGSLEDHTWDFGDNDDLGYETIYIRDNDGDPDETNIFIEMGARNTAVKVMSKSFITFDGIEFKHNNHNTWYAVFHSYNSTNITIKNCKIHNGGTVLFFWSDVDQNSDLLIENCSIHHCITTTEYGGILKLTDTKNSVIRNCNIYHGSDMTTADIITLASDNYKCEYITVENCELSYSNNAIYMNPDVDNCIIRYNVIHNTVEGIIVRDGSDNNKIYYNLLYDTEHAIIATTPKIPIKKIDVFNNTIYNTRDNSHGVTFKGEVNSVNFINNVVYVGKAAALKMDISNLLNVNSNNNCLYSFENSRDFIFWGNIKFSMLEFLDYVKKSDNDFNSVNKDPLFVDEINKDFNLKYSSICIDKGVDVGLIIDFWGNKIDNYPDIGAFEFIYLKPPQNLHLKNIE